MRVLMLIGYDLCAAPWATRPLALARELLAMGHQVRLCHYPLPDTTALMHNPAHWGLAPMGLDKRRWRSAAANLRGWISWCDVLHVQKPVSANLLLLRLAWDRKKPLVYDWDDWEGRGGISERFYSKSRVWRVGAAERYFARRAQRILYSNDTIARELARAHERVERTDFVPCGADTDHFDARRFDDAERTAMRERLKLGPGPVVVYHGQLDVDSEQELMLEMLARLRRDLPVSFLALGGGRMLERLRARAAELALDDAVRYTGYVAYQDVPAHLAVADAAVVLFPKALYAQCKSPLKLYETMAMGLPVVGTHIGQLVPLLWPNRGLLCAPHQPTQVEDALRQLLTHRDQARAMGHRARLHIENHHTWRRAALRLERAYQAALEPSRADTRH